MDVHQIITLGIGTPSDIAHLTLFGLSPTGPVETPVTSVTELVGVYHTAYDLSGTHGPISVTGRYGPITLAGQWESD